MIARFSKRFDVALSAEQTPARAENLVPLVPDGESDRHFSLEPPLFFTRMTIHTTIFLKLPLIGKIARP